MNWRMIGVVLLLALPRPVSATAQTIADEVANVHALDSRLAAVMFRLDGAIGPLCRRQMPLTGMVLHARSQYAPAFAQALEAAGAFPSEVAVWVVVPGSPAALAGLRRGDGLVAIEGAQLDTAGSGARDTSARDRVETTIAAQPPDAPLHLTVRRAGEADVRNVTILPRIGCRTRWEVTFDKQTLGESDGDTIQLAASFIATSDDAEVAAIAAHELGHTALEHRRKLEAQGARFGALSAYARSGRLIRAAEDEADLVSVHILRAAGYDPASAAAFWEGPGRRYSGGIFRSPTHAPARERAAAIRAEIARDPGGTGCFAPAGDAQGERDLAYFRRNAPRPDLAARDLSCSPRPPG